MTLKRRIRLLKRRMMNYTKGTMNYGVKEERSMNTLIEYPFRQKRILGKSKRNIIR